MHCPVEQEVRTISKLVFHDFPVPKGIFKQAKRIKFVFFNAEFKRVGEQVFWLDNSLIILNVDVSK